jgi:hypothetical protein
VNWLYSLWYGYFWPSLKGNGPEALVQTVTYGAVGLTLIPVVRKFLRNEAKKAHLEILAGEHELEKVGADLLKPFKSVVRWVTSIRLTVKKQAPVVEAEVKKDLVPPPAP